MDVKYSKPEWIIYLLEVLEKEEAQRITPLTHQGRFYIWKCCERLRLNKHGIPGQACHLLERYLTKMLFSKLSLPSGKEVVESFMRDMKGKLKLIIGCCIHLAVKMYKRHNDNNIRCLIFKQNYSTKDIVKMEAKVFQALDFYIPSTTTVEIAQLLALEVKVTRTVLKEVDHLTNQAELYKPSVIDKVKWVANYDDPAATICRLHLAAGGVAAAGYHVGHSADPAPPLAELTNTSALYITAIAHAILHVVELRTDEHP